MNLEALLTRFHGVRRNGAGWMALCPAHDDRNESLSITQADSKVLLHCHAGCSVEDVCAAAAIEMRELFSDNATSPRHIAVTYDYQDESGKLLFQVVRFEPKDFRQRRPDGEGGWQWNLNGTRRVLYRLPEVLAGKSVLVCEGEKDCETARALGLVATCNAGGAGKWIAEHSELLRGKQITIIADADEPGRKHAQQVAASLFGNVESLKVLELPGAKDLSEWKSKYNFSRDALLDLIRNAPEWKAGNLEKWRELFDTFEEFEDAKPTSFSINDVLQKEAITAIAGLSGHSKTWVALAVTRALLFGPGMLWGWFEVPERAERVIYLIPESSRGPFKARLKVTGLYDEVYSGRLLVRTLSKGPAPDLDDKRLLYAAKNSTVILDTGIRFMNVTDESSAAEVAEGLSNDMLGLLRAEATSVLPLFHSPKSFAKESVMTLENMIRGSSEIGAVLATAWGIKQIDEPSNIIHVENLKARDFEHCGPFQIIGRPYIDRNGDFQLYKNPEQCGYLADEQPAQNKKNADRSAARAANIALVAGWDRESPGLTSTEIVAKFATVGIEVTDGSVRGYRMALRKGGP